MMLWYNRHVVLFQRMGVIWNIISNTLVKKRPSGYSFFTLSDFIWSPHTSSQTNLYKRDGSRVKRPSPESTKQNFGYLCIQGNKSSPWWDNVSTTTALQKKKEKKAWMGRNICAILHCCCLQPRVEITCTPRSITLWITPPQRWSIFSNLNQSS